MERRDFPILGRKVFFVNPPLSISTYVFEALKEDQFEAYCIDNYKVAKITNSHEMTIEFNAYFRRLKKEKRHFRKRFRSNMIGQPIVHHGPDEPKNPNSAHFHRS